MTDAAWAFRGFHFPAEVILWAVRWYLQFPISYRDLERMLADRGVEVDHTTMYRWVQRFAPELEKRVRRPICGRAAGHGTSTKPTSSRRVLAVEAIRGHRRGRFATTREVRHLLSSAEPRATSPACAGSRSTSPAPITPAKPACGASASRLRGTTPIWPS